MATPISQNHNFYTFFEFTQKQIDRMTRLGRTRTAETYSSTLRSFKQFRHNRDIPLDNITPDTIELYEAYLRDNGLLRNTIGFYMRVLRAIYNRAVQQGITAQRHPFANVYAGVDRTVKRALSISELRRIKSLDLKAFPAADYARDMFMLSFYLRGMSFVDMAFLRASDLHGNHIIYRRRKTGQPLTIEWTDEMQALVDKYPRYTDTYLLPIIRTVTVHPRTAYRNANYNINHNLKRVASILGIKIPLTLYVARHSWASAAKATGIPLSVISEGMGHNNEATTQIYLTSLDTAIVDRANEIIIRLL